MNQNALYAKRYLMEKYGYSDVQASGIVGNLIQESSMNTGAVNRGDGSDGSDSIGIAQWNGGRAKGLRNFASDRGSDVGNIDTQLDYIHHELNTSESAAGNRLRAADNIHDATAAFIGYERPQGWTAKSPTSGHGWDNRFSHAQKLAGQSGEGAQAMAMAQAKSGYTPLKENPLAASVQEKMPDDSAPKAGILLQAYNKITGSNVTPPKTIPDNVPLLGGADTSKVMEGIGGIGDFAKILTAQDDAINTQMSAIARSAAARTGSDVPVEIAFEPTQVMKRKRRGGLGGIGGYLV